MSWEEPKEDKSDGGFRDPYTSDDQNGEFVGEGGEKGDTFTAGGWDDLDTGKTRRVVIGPDTGHPTAQHRKVPAALLCSAMTVGGALEGGLLGGIIGIFMGFPEGRQTGATGTDLARGVAGSLPVISSRNPRMIVGSMMSSALIMGAIDGVSSIFGNKR